MKNNCAIASILILLFSFAFGVVYLYDLTVEREVNIGHSKEIQKTIKKIDSIIYALEYQKKYLYKVDTIIN